MQHKLETVVKESRFKINNMNAFSKVGRSKKKM